MPDNPTGRHIAGVTGSVSRAGVPATRNLQVKLTELELKRYRAESVAAGDADLSSTVRRMFEAAIAARAAGQGDAR